MPNGCNVRGAGGSSDQCSAKAWVNKKSLLSLDLKTDKSRCLWQWLPDRWCRKIGKHAKFRICRKQQRASAWDFKKKQSNTCTHCLNGLFQSEIQLAGCTWIFLFQTVDPRWSDRKSSYTWSCSPSPMGHQVYDPHKDGDSVLQFGRVLHHSFLLKAGGHPRGITGFSSSVLFDCHIVFWSFSWLEALPDASQLM